MKLNNSHLVAALVILVSGPCTAASVLPDFKPVLPDFSAATFVPGTAVDNPYFPVGAGPTKSYYGANEEESERIELSYAGPGKTLLGVETVAQLDRVTEDGVVVEETYDYYAQDTDGNVWYMGEDVVNYRYDDDGNFLGTDNASAWLAGENGALPGIMMLADPVVGADYYQEYAVADEGLDQAGIYALGVTVDLGWTSFEDVLVTFETSELDPEARELKYYAPGIGLIRAESGVSLLYTDPELTVDLQAPASVAPVPLPASFPFLIAGVAGLGFLGRHRIRSTVK